MAKLDEIINDTPELNYDPETAMSERFQQAQKSVDWGNHPYFSLAEADKVSNEPVNRVYGAEDLENITSDVGTIAWDTFRKGVLDLSSIGDKAQLALGNTLAGISGNTLGTEMRDKAADNLMKTMEDSRFIDSNYGDAETWTARFVGGGMSMGEMIAIGALTGPVGLGAYVGTTSLADGALNDAAKYMEENGSLEGYETDPTNLALDYANAVFQVGSELALGTGRLINGKVLKAGSTGGAVLKETLDNFLQESLQGAASDVTEVLKGNQDISILKENALGYIKDGVVAGALGGAISGTTYKLNKNRALANLDKINQKLHPDKDTKEIHEISEDVFEKTEQAMEKSFVPELIAHTEVANDKGQIRDNVRQKVEMMYRDNEDMTEKQKAKAIEATTTTELENMLYDSIERKVPLTANPLLQGEVNELGWFREGIPENRRAEINALNYEIRELKNERTQALETKDYVKLDELDTKISEFRKNLPEKMKDLVVADREEIQNMLDEQRKMVEDSRAKKQLFQKVKQMAKKAAEKQDVEEEKLAEQIATGAEKAKAKREKAETAQQTKEAKIRTLTEQRQIASAIKRVKLKAEQNKVAQPSVQTHYEEESGYNTLKEAGLTDEEIQKMSYRDMMDKLDQIKKAKETAPEPEVMLQGETFSPAMQQRKTASEERETVIEKLNNLEKQPLLRNTETGELVMPTKIGNIRVVDRSMLEDQEVVFGYEPATRSFIVPIDDIQNKSIKQIQQEISEKNLNTGIFHEDIHRLDHKGVSDIDIQNRFMEDVNPDISMKDYYNLPEEAHAFAQQTINQIADSISKMSIEERERVAGHEEFVERMVKRAKDYYKWNKENVEYFRKLVEDLKQYILNNLKDPRYYQSKISSKGISGKTNRFRGAYIPEYRFIAMTENMDASTLAHELAHDWGQEYFRWARSGKASESFMKSWGAVEKAIGITDKDTYFTYDASEKFARAYEGWLLERKDWADILHINTDEEKKAVEEMMEDYRKELVDIYDSLTNPYFTMAWGKVGELKPELKQWFERSTKFESLDEQVRRGEITAEQAGEEKLRDLVETATNNTVQNMSEEDKKVAQAIEGLEKLETQAKETADRFDVKGGNRNSIQARLNQIALAKDLVANDEALGKYDTHRDMLEVAKAADEFVRTRQEDAIKIINGEMAEQDGLFASDLYTALERVAKQTGNFELIDELRHSRVATELAKELGQRVAGFRNYTGDGDLDIVSALKKVDKIYDKAYNETEKDNLSADLKAWAEDLQATDSLSDAKLDEFFKDMECQ